MCSREDHFIPPDGWREFDPFQKIKTKTQKRELSIDVAKVAPRQKNFRKIEISGGYSVPTSEDVK